MLKRQRPKISRPVSYTHLDVYKRQDLLPAIKQLYLHHSQHTHTHTHIRKTLLSVKAKVQKKAL